jgi:hypothetical protein
MTTALSADENYTHLICKNPLSAKWRVLECHNTAFDLFDLAKHLTLKSKFDTFLKRHKKKIERRFAQNDPRYVQGRNCALFDDLRLYAYSFVKGHKASRGTFDSFLANLFEYAQNLNAQFPSPLPFSEIKSTVKSVAKWTWNKFTGNVETCNRGVMGFGQTRRENPELAALSLEEIKNRQRQAATRTQEIKRATTEQKIKEAINALIAAKEVLNNSSIARKAGLERKTVVVFSKAFEGCVNWWYQVVGAREREGKLIGLLQRFTDSQMMKGMKRIAKNGISYVAALRNSISLVFGSSRLSNRYLLSIW